MKIYENEVPKHIKKKESSTSKSKVKSKHKHEYADCLFVDKEDTPRKGTYCKICGKIGDMYLGETEKDPDRPGLCRMLDYDEVFEKYKDLEKVHVEDIFQRYVTLSNIK